MMKFNSYIFTGDKQICTGCGACAKSCIHEALIMKPDEEGFLYPVVNTDKCIKCGLCERVCPVVGKKQCNTEDKQHCYIATTNDSEYYSESATIGVCTLLSEHFIKNGGVVYGCFLDESDWCAYHIRVQSLDGIQKIRNSKYLQSNLKNTYLDAKNDLINGLQVLFIGTPCQISGLKAFLKKDYNNLTTLDIICHGTFSPILMPLEISYWEKLFSAKISNFRFRSKRKYKHTNCGMVNFDITTPKGTIRHIERHASASPSYHCFAYSNDGQNYNLRPSCYKCPMRSKERYGDITVGDPWNVDTLIRKELKGNFLLQSIFSANTMKGKIVIDAILPHFTALEKTREELFCQNAVLPTHRDIPAKRALLYSGIKKKEYSLLVEELFQTNLERNHRKFVMNYIKNRVKNKIKAIIKCFIH